MKRALLFSLIFFVTCLCVFAYETVIIKFPEGQLWVRGYYKKVGNEAILQYVPSGQSRDNWMESVVIHSYNHSTFPINVFINNNNAKMVKINPTAQYRTLKLRADDAIIGRCTEDYKNIKGQCEFFRATRAHGGIITIHYMNKNKEMFMNNYSDWYNRIKRAKFYNSYYRNERTFNKSEYFEL